MNSFILLTCCLLVYAQANENTVQRMERLESEDDNRDDGMAFETFNSPVYGASDAITKSGGLAANGKSAFSVPPVLPAVPGAYSPYLNGLYPNSYGYNAAYSRYGHLPYASPYYGYGSGYGSPYTLGYGYGAGYGYPGALPYGNSVLGRTGYNFYGYGGYPGYRYGGLGYPAGLRAPIVPGPVPGVPAPVPAVPAPVPAIPGPVPAYRAPLAPVQNKDGTIRYAYAPVAGQRITVY